MGSWDLRAELLSGLLGLDLCDLILEEFTALVKVSNWELLEDALVKLWLVNVAVIVNVAISKALVGVFCT